MPLIALARIAFSALSWAVLGLAAYFLWMWWSGDPVLAADGVVRRAHEARWLWAGLGLLAWSGLGRFIVPWLVARPGGLPSRPDRGPGQQVTGESGARLQVEFLGRPDAPTILFTHGWGLDSTIWHYAKQDFAARYRLIVWDLPGLGKSSLPADRGVSLERFASDLAAVIAFNGGRPLVLVGHSIGGMTIQTLARLRPALFGREIAGVVLLNTTHTNPLKTMVASPLAQALRRPLIEPLMRLAILFWPLAWLGAWQGYLNGSAHLANRLGFGRHVTHSQLEHTTLLATRNSPAVQAKGNLAMFRWDADGGLSEMRCPTLILGGDVDLVTKLEASIDIADAVAGARLQVAGGANHMGFLERSKIYNGAIEAFAASVFEPESLGVFARARSGGAAAAG